MTNRIPRHLALPILACAATCIDAAPAAAQGVRTVVIDSAAVRPVLRRLWDESVRTNREQVACVGGERRGSFFRLTRAVDLVDVLAAGRAGTHATALDSDSMSVSRASSEASVEACAPPRWSGTVHTHRVEGGAEHPGLSSGDRAVVSLWHERWRSQSVFCVLFSRDEPPTCEWRPGRD